MSAFLLLPALAIGLLLLGLALLREDQSGSSTATMSAIRFWSGIISVAAVLAIVVLFLYALITQ